MRTIIIEGIVAVLVIFFLAVTAIGMLMMAGCQQVIVETDIQQGVVCHRRVQINTFGMEIDFDKLQYRDILRIDNYDGDPQEVEAIGPGGAIKTKSAPDNDKEP